MEAAEARESEEASSHPPAQVLRSRRTSPKQKKKHTKKAEQEQAVTTETAANGGSWLNYVRVGARLHFLEWAPLCLAPVVWLCSATPVREFFLQNAVTQLLLFLFVVQVPAYLSERMAYVDIGWPTGLVMIAANAYFLGTGLWLRKAVVCGALGLHGLRMSLGGLFLFGKQTGWTYRFEKDLPRYEYAKVRWLQEGMPASHWWLKIQHDTLQQCFANIAVLPAPVALMAFNPDSVMSPMEWLGLGMWLLSWLLESAADGQKQLFLAKCKSRTAVLGHTPWDTPAYSLWTLSRHPNYFGEWLCWIGFVVAAIPTLLNTSNKGLQQEFYVQLGFGVIFYGVIRFFYDCLVYWTGAEPAEHFSVLKRPAFRDYQSNVRVFFPFEVPFLDHHRTPGWPDL